MLQSLKSNRKRLLTEIAIEQEKLQRAPPNATKRVTILARLAMLYYDLSGCEHTIRSLQGS